MKIITTISLTLFCLILASCGGNGVSGGGNVDDSDEVDLAKLVGTPFEGMSIGDDISWCKFQKEEFLTSTVPSLPIPIFTAFFTSSEEKIIQSGVQIANDAAEQEIFRLVDSWSNDVRVIYKVKVIADDDFTGDHNPDAAGSAIPTYYNAEGKDVSDVIVTDWQIEILDSSFDSSSDALVIAHELGHAFGIISHALIDYDTDKLLPLEEQSIMLSGDQAKDYGLMMKAQTELYLNHVGETAINPVSCP